MERVVLTHKGLRSIDVGLMAMSIVLTGLIIHSVIKYKTVSAVELLFYIILLSVIIWFLIKSIKSIKYRKPRLIIESKGIELCEANKTVPWNEIKHVYTKRVSQGKYSTVELIITLLKETDYEYCYPITEISNKTKQMKEAVEFFSGRNIWGLESIFKENIKEIAADAEQPSLIAELVDDYYKKITVRGGITFVAIIIFIFLQIWLSFPYTLAFGVSGTVLLCMILNYIDEQNLKSNEAIRFLTKEQIEKIFWEKEKSLNYIFPEKKLIPVRIIFCVLIFVASYLINKYLL